MHIDKHFDIYDARYTRTADTQSRTVDASEYLTGLVLEGSAHLTVDAPEGYKNREKWQKSCDEFNALYFVIGKATAVAYRGLVEDVSDSGFAVVESVRILVLFFSLMLLMILSLSFHVLNLDDTRRRSRTVIARDNGFVHDLRSG